MFRVASLLLVGAVCAGLLPSVSSQCTQYPLNSHSRLTAIQHGVTFTSVPTQASPSGFTLCLSIGGGGFPITDPSLGFSPAVGAQLDTGSTGVVVPRPTLPAHSYLPTGVCHVFDFDSSLNSYFGEMVYSHVRLFGADTDGRYLETNPMPLLAVEYKCTGAACLPSLAPYNEDCAAIRAVIGNLTIWKATTVNSTTAMVGIGMNRGASDEGYSIGPNPISRNPILNLNLDPLALTLNIFDFFTLGTVPVNSLCKSQLTAQSTWSTSTTRFCNWDPADPWFSLPSFELIAYGFLLNATNILPLYTYPEVAGNKLSPVSEPVFSCQSFPKLQPSSNPPLFPCWDTSALYQKVEILSQPTANLTSSSTAVWTGLGQLLSDTGLAYYVDNVYDFPCVNSGKLAFRMTFPVPSPTSTQTNTPYTWTFDVDWSKPTGSGTAIYYPTSQGTQTPAQPQPTQLRLWRHNTTTTCTPPANLPNPTHAGLMNSGRFLYHSFVFFADFINGVQGYADATDFAHVFTGGYKKQTTTTTTTTRKPTTTTTHRPTTTRRHN